MKPSYLTRSILTAALAVALAWGGPAYGQSGRGQGPSRHATDQAGRLAASTPAASRENDFYDPYTYDAGADDISSPFIYDPYYDENLYDPYYDDDVYDYGHDNGNYDTYPDEPSDYDYGNEVYEMFGDGVFDGSDNDEVYGDPGYYTSYELGHDNWFGGYDDAGETGLADW